MNFRNNYCEWQENNSCYPNEYFTDYNDNDLEPYDYEYNNYNSCRSCNRNNNGCINTNPCKKCNCNNHNNNDYCNHKNNWNNRKNYKKFFLCGCFKLLGF